MVQKTKKVQRDDGNTSSEGMSDSGSSDSEADGDNEALKQKMINKMLQEADSEEGSDDEDGSGS